jgi:FtsH-binding integral membrane protein
VLFRKYSRRTVGLAGLGLLVTVGVAAFLVLTESYPTPPHELSTPMLVTILVFCPASLLSALFIDAEIGTSGFYFIWFLSPCSTRLCMRRLARQLPVVTGV